MPITTAETRALLIGGRSGVGKSTVALAILRVVGWPPSGLSTEATR
ncbi:hypothetical protein ACF1AJ_03840 [Leifsonia sp. NPDC014704]